MINYTINGCISGVFWKLLKYFNDTLTLPLFSIPPAIFVLNLNKALLLLAGKSAIAPLLSKNVLSL